MNEFGRTVPDTPLVDLSIRLDDSQAVTDGIRNDRSGETDECLTLSKSQRVHEYDKQK